MRHPGFFLLPFLVLNTLFAGDAFQKSMKTGDEANAKKQFQAAAEAYGSAFAKADATSRKYQAGTRYAGALFRSGKLADAIRVGKTVMELPELAPADRSQATYLYAWYLLRGRKPSDAELILEKAVKEPSAIQFDMYDLYLNALCAQKKIIAAEQVMPDMEKAARTKSQKTRAAQKKSWLEGKKK